MDTAASIVTRAFELFRSDATEPPPLTLRGANAVDSYDVPTPFDPAQDEPTDAYLEGFGFWGIGYLDARSWRHYLPRLIGYAFSFGAWTGLRALAAARRSLRARCIDGALTFSLGLTGAYLGGATGVAWGYAVTGCLRSLNAWWQFTRALRERELSSPHS